MRSSSADFTPGHGRESYPVLICDRRLPCFVRTRMIIDPIPNGSLWAVTVKLHLDKSIRNTSSLFRRKALVRGPFCSTMIPYYKVRYRTCVRLQLANAQPTNTGKCYLHYRVPHCSARASFSSRSELECYYKYVIVRTPLPTS